MPELYEALFVCPVRHFQQGTVVLSGALANARMGSNINTEHARKSSGIGSRQHTSIGSLSVSWNPSEQWYQLWDSHTGCRPQYNISRLVLRIFSI
ncbi:MAG: hypothetical protein ACLTDC_10695 [Lachnospiraceae bacterium]